MKEFNENFDPETTLYEFLNETKNKGLDKTVVPNCIIKTLHLFEKRFGHIEHVLKTTDEELCKELEDCIQALSKSDEDMKQFVPYFENELPTGFHVIDVFILVLLSIITQAKYNKENK